MSINGHGVPDSGQRDPTMPDGSNESVVWQPCRATYSRVSVAQEHDQALEGGPLVVATELQHPTCPGLGARKPLFSI